MTEINKEVVNPSNNEYYKLSNNLFILKRIKNKLEYTDLDKIKSIRFWWKAYLLDLSDKKDNILFMIDTNTQRLYVIVKPETIEFISLKDIKNNIKFVEDFVYWTTVWKLYFQNFTKKYKDLFNKVKNTPENISIKDTILLEKINIFLSVFKLKVFEKILNSNDNVNINKVITYHIQHKTIRPIDLLYLKNLWELDNQDYQKYLPQVKELLKIQLTDEYYKIFLQIPIFLPFSHITQKELDFYAGKIKEYKANIPWIWKIVLKLDKPIISEEEYQEYSKKLSELKEKYLGETQQDILNLQEEIKFTSMNELIQAIREHKLKEFWQIKKEYGINKDKEKLRENILKLVKKHYKPYNKLSNEEKKIVEKLIIWVEVNSN